MNRKTRVERTENGVPLRDFLAARLGISQRKAKELLDSRTVFVNGRRTWMARHLLKTSDEVEFPAPGPQRAPDNPAIPVLHRDAWIVAVNKPPGLTSNGPGSVEERLRVQLGMPGLCAVHRLDRDTTGCLLFAVSDDAKDAMVELFRAGRIRKTYHAVVTGNPPSEPRTVTRPLEGKTAVTHVRTLSTAPAGALLEITIETGRTHQVRKHLADLGLVLVGEKQYQGSSAVPRELRRVAHHLLHARRIALPHPDGGSRHLDITAPYPEAFRNFLVPGKPSRMTRTRHGKNAEGKKTARQKRRSGSGPDRSSSGDGR